MRMAGIVVVERDGSVFWGDVRAQKRKHGGVRLRVIEFYGGAERDRTADLLVANEALSQLSYSPTSHWEL